MIIYTLGTNKRTEQEFKKILNHYKIEVIFDVRRFPNSQFEHFKKENIEKICKENRIAYYHLGKELGGYRKGGYQRHIKTEDFKKGLKIIKARAKDKITCILCAEKIPFRCHRRFIASELEKEGINIIHIIEIDQTLTNITQKI